ncbi:hypothetical protein P7C70_g5794, partial [Phenoliferia sp. Uapishka_3]
MDFSPIVPGMPEVAAAALHPVVLQSECPRGLLLDVLRSEGGLLTTFFDGADGDALNSANDLDSDMDLAMSERESNEEFGKSAFNSRWTSEETSQLKKLVPEAQIACSTQVSWEVIAKRLGTGRTAEAVFSKIRRMNHGNLPGKPRDIDYDKTSDQWTRWTPDQNVLLKKLVCEVQNLNGRCELRPNEWATIAARFGRTASAVTQHWTKLNGETRKGKKGSEKERKNTPALHHGEVSSLYDWRPSGDSELKRLQSLGHGWSWISESLPGCDPKSCERRWSFLDSQPKEVETIVIDDSDSEEEAEGVKNGVSMTFDEEVKPKVRTVAAFASADDSPQIAICRFPEESRKHERSLSPLSNDQSRKRHHFDDPTNSTPVSSNFGVLVPELLRNASTSPAELAEGVFNGRSVSTSSCSAESSSSMTRGRYTEQSHASTSGLSADDREELKIRKQLRAASGDGLDARERKCRESIRTDLTVERPAYALTCYGPGKCEPNLIQGDLSPEELHFQFYNARIANNESLYTETKLIAEAESQVQGVLGNVEGAFEFASNQSATKSAQAPAAIVTPTRPSAFGAFGTPTPSNNAFGAPSTTPFGTPASSTPNPFGAPATSAFGGTSAFGAPKPSAFGGTSGAFGAPAVGGAFGTPTGGGAFGTPASNPFGTPATSSAGTGGGFGAFAGGSSTATTSAFGQSGFAPAVAAPKPATSGGAFRQAAFGQSAFGTSATPAFGQSAFGQPAAPTPAFGQPTAPAFGQAAPAPAFGASAFPTSTSSAFGAPAFGTPAPAFGSPATSGGGGFGAFAQSGNSTVAPAFVASSTPAFGAPSAPSAFGNPSTPSAFGTPAAPSAFGTSNPAFGSTPAPAFGTPSAPSAFAAGGIQGPPKPATSAFGAGGVQGTSAFGAGGVQGVSAFGAGGVQGAPSAFGSSTGVFGKPATAPPANPFGAPATPSTGGFGAFGGGSGGAFGQPATGGAFGKPASGGAFGGGAFGKSTPAMAPSGGSTKDPYAAIEQALEKEPRAEDMNAWQAERFSWGAIPIRAPPVSVR